MIARLTTRSAATSCRVTIRGVSGLWQRSAMFVALYYPPGLAVRWEV